MSLTRHQKTSKYCLDIRGVSQSNQFVCDHCSKVLTTSQRLTTHYLSCSKNALSILVTELKQKDELILSLKEENNNLKDRLENIAIKAATKSTTTNKNNTYIQNLLPVTDQHFLDNLPNLTIEHIKKGAEGYAQYALEYPLKDRVACVDYSRRKVKYKDHDGNVITDPEMSNLTQKFFKSIQDRNKDLFRECAIEFRQKCDEDSFDKMAFLAETLAGVSASSNGDRSEFSHEFVKEVCKATMREGTTSINQN
jgi:dsDNA-binding SOS-regulon protein